MAKRYTIEGLREEGAPVLASVLIACVREQRTVTYGQIAALLEKQLGIEKVFSTHTGGVAGHMMEALLRVDPAVPALNALLVSQKGVPGGGATSYVDRRRLSKKSYSDMTDAERIAHLPRLARECRDYNRWDELYQAAFGNSLSTWHVTEPVRDGGSADGLGRGGTAESPEHKHMKDEIAANPALIGLPSGAVPSIEHRLLSGDEIDILFTTPQHATIVEVKSSRSNEADIERGIFQCVKYRAVYAAQLGSGHDDQGVRAWLVVQNDPPEHLRQQAKRLDVRCLKLAPLVYE